MESGISKACADSMRKACMTDEAESKTQAPPHKACLYAVEMFQDIPPQEMQRLNAMLPLKKFNAGEIIFDPSRPRSALFIVKCGRVRIFYLSAQGKAFTLSIIEEGGVFGEMPLIGQHLHDSYVEALEDSEVCVLKEHEVKQFLLHDHRVAVRISQILGRKVLELEERLADLALKPLPQRVASLLLRLGSKPSFSWRQKHMQVSLTHEQIASVAGATREAVSKTLSDFAAEGLIMQSRAKITLIDEAGLRALARSQ